MSSPKPAETPGETSPMLDENGRQEPGNNSMNTISLVTLFLTLIQKSSIVLKVNHTNLHESFNESKFILSEKFLWIYGKIQIPEKL